MNSSHSSHYFESVARHIRLYSGKKAITVLKRLVENDGCPNESVDPVVNGAIADYLTSIITPENHTGSPFNPTYQELINFLTDREFDLPEERVKKLLDYLMQRSVLHMGTDERLYRIKLLMPNQLIWL